ncbi:glycosyltransferase family 29 protein [Cellulomonas edaphi]|uniref:Glycosyltransferase family 29 protein n=1 Tax=Cellulomonas edaphi TaxID=3053468 RepID=A0ABT7SAL0_9CELL|nr:glycosyltransferase family 29 protein [Cellulomons edaphi]MDM7831994.1 glycosyltransferase family 29 protein [Cellulomons edaphi]
MNTVRHRTRRAVKRIGTAAAVSAAPSLRLNRRYADVAADVATTASGLSASSQWQRIALTQAVLTHAQALAELRRNAMRSLAVESGIKPWHAAWPSLFTSLLDVARRAESAGETDLAVEVYRLLADSRPASQGSWRGLATSLDARGDYAGARAASDRYCALTGRRVPLPHDGAAGMESGAAAGELDAALAALSGGVRADDAVDAWVEAERVSAVGGDPLPTFAAALAATRRDGSGFGAGYDALVARTVASGESAATLAPLVTAVNRARRPAAGGRLTADDAAALQTLDMSGLRGYLAGRSVCLVANSARLLEHDAGPLIDSYDVVVRFNSFAIDAPHTGTKTDVHATIHLHSFNWSHPVDVRLVFSGKRDLWRTSVLDHVQPGAQTYLGDESLRWPALNLFTPTERADFKVPTTGFNTLRLIDFLDVSTAIDLVGFDFYDGGAYRVPEAMHLPVAAAHSYENERRWVMDRAVATTDITISLR